MCDKRKKRENVHHSLPRSRFREFSNASWNLRVVDRKRHDAWHLLVMNRSTCEAILMFIEEFGPDGLAYLRLDPAFGALIQLLKEVERKSDPKT